MPPQQFDTDVRPFVLIWEVTQACDLSCKHCRADAKPERHHRELSTNEGKALLDEATEFGSDQLVVLSGGDPLLREDIVELVAYGTQTGLRMTLTPSGTSSLTTSKIAQLADAGLRRMALSLDGPTASSHDAFRQESGSFNETITAAKHARSIALPLQINTTVCAETVESLPAIRDLVQELDAVLWSVFFLVPIGRGNVLDPISPSQAERVMKWLTDVADAAPFGVKTTEAPHYRRVAIQQDRAADATVHDRRDSIGRHLGITAGDGFAFVSHTGAIYPSGFLPKTAGNVRDTSLVTAYRNSELFNSLRDPDALNGKCGVCSFRNICGGSRSRAFAYTGDHLASDPLCAYIPPDYDGDLPPTLTDTGLTHH